MQSSSSFVCAVKLCTSTSRELREKYMVDVFLRILFWNGNDVYHHCLRFQPGTKNIDNIYLYSLAWEENRSSSKRKMQFADCLTLIPKRSCDRPFRLHLLNVVYYITVIWSIKNVVKWNEHFKTFWTPNRESDKMHQSNPKAKAKEGDGWTMDMDGRTVELIFVAWRFLM